MAPVNPSAPDPGHAPVMLEPVLEAMALRSGDSALDCTAGPKEFVTLTTLRICYGNRKYVFLAKTPAIFA